MTTAAGLDSDGCVVITLGILSGWTSKTHSVCKDGTGARSALVTCGNAERLLRPRFRKAADDLPSVAIRCIQFSSQPVVFKRRASGRVIASRWNLAPFLFHVAVLVLGKAPPCPVDGSSDP